MHSHFVPKTVFPKKGAVSEKEFLFQIYFFFYIDIMSTHILCLACVIVL